MSNFMDTKLDSRPDTEAHISRVNEMLLSASYELQRRGSVHDASKLEEPEKSAFDRLKALSLSGMAYGSEEYRACLRKEKPAIQHHYDANSHHPEHFKLFKCAVCKSVLKENETWLPNINDNPPRICSKCCPMSPIYECEALPYIGLEGMDLFDLLEMLIDWKAASERMANGGDISKSIELNRDRFNISPQLESILRNTAISAGWIQQPAAAAQPKPGDWMREAAADIIELTRDHPPKTSEELVKLLDTGAKVIAEHCPAQPKRGDAQILIEALEAIALNEDRANLDGDSAEVALEQCNTMAEEALDEYRKSQPKREVSARELIKRVLKIRGEPGAYQTIDSISLKIALDELESENRPESSAISAQQFVAWLSKKYENTDHQPTAWAISGELNHMLEERARADKGGDSHA